MQDHHTSRVHKYCIDDCKIGKEVYQLGTELIFDEKDAKRKIKLKWDYICWQALVLRRKGYLHIKNVYQFGCHVSSLRKQLNQCGL
ncbi:zinc-finger domain-containing protein [Bacillus mycoides]|uniref:zinc-finger domain-containing protein n=1 Tax=Bacillus mycoides TaxID=1405 RepID=UPI003D662338